MAEPSLGPDRMPVELPILRPLFDALGVGIWSTDAAGVVTACSPQAERILGYPEEVLVGRVLHDLAHRSPAGDPLPAADCPILGVLRDARPAEGTGATFRRSDASLINVNWGAAPTVLAGEVTGSIVAFFDASREQRARERVEYDLAVARDSSERFRLMAEVGILLAGGLELREALRRLAALVVPALGDWSVVDLYQPTNTFRRAAVAHREPARLQGVVRELELPPPEAAGEAPGAGSLEQVVSGADQVLIDDFAAIEPPGTPLAVEERRLFDQLGSGSAAVASLRVGGRLLGALTVVREERDAFSPEDLALLQDVARRAALAVDSARAYALQRRAAEALQRALLTEPPDVPGLSVAARYLPAVAETRLGGDWYDAFRLPDGSLGVVIGDVAGHDIPAAAVMAQVRNLLRAHAVQGGSPAQVLDRLETTLGALDVDDMVTLLYGQLATDTTGWRFTWSNAGHLPPLVIDGESVGYLPTSGDLPVGVLPMKRTESSVILRPGSTLVLFTDGLVERRDQSIDTGLAELSRAASGLGGDPEPLLDGLLEQFAAEPADDVAVLAVRVGAAPDGR